MRTRLLSFSFALIFFGVTSAHALCDGTPLFEDMFDDNLTGWTEDDNQVFKDGGYVFSSEEGGSESNVIPSFYFKPSDAIFCIEIDTQVPENGYSGIIFWHASWKDYYLAWIDTEDNELVISRYINDGWITVRRSPLELPDAAIDASLVVSTEGNIITTYFNDSEIQKVRAQAPREQFRVGLYAGAGDTVFRSLRVTEE